MAIWARASPDDAAYLRLSLRADEAKWFACPVTPFFTKRANSARPHGRKRDQESPTKALCAEGRNRTGDTWFFRSCSDRYANSRLNTLATTHGYGRQQIVQQDGEQASPSFAVTPESPSDAMDG